jgi:hypothetical protein
METIMSAKSFLRLFLGTKHFLTAKKSGTSFIAPLHHVLE